jgi:hypothetical protein
MGTERSERHLWPKRPPLGGPFLLLHFSLTKAFCERRMLKVHKYGRLQMSYIIEILLCLTIIITTCFLNAGLGFLGMVIGRYRSEDKPRAKFLTYLRQKEGEFWKDRSQGDISVFIAIFIFAIAGIALFFLLPIGGASKEKRLPALNDKHRR